MRHDDLVNISIIGVLICLMLIINACSTIEIKEEDMRDYQDKFEQCDIFLHNKSDAFKNCMEVAWHINY